jgi:hypothetical protein
MYPIVCGLLKKHFTTAEGESPLIRKMTESIANELKTRYNPFNKEIASSQPVIASLLDPRYKSFSFFSDEQKKLAWETLETKLDDIPLHLFKKQNVNDEEIAPKKPKVQRSLDFLLCDEPDDPYEETGLSLYKRERCDPSVNPLKWWKENSIKYPRLSVLAR